MVSESENWEIHLFRRCANFDPFSTTWTPLLYEFLSDGSPSFDRPDPDKHDLGHLACRKTLTSEIP